MEQTNTIKESSEYYLIATQRNYINIMQKLNEISAMIAKQTENKGEKKNDKNR